MVKKNNIITPEDQLLIDRSLSGHRSAQGTIYRKYAKAMFHVAIRIVPDRATATDLTQDVFIKVFEELGRFRGESTLGAWIKRITINTCLNHLKKVGRLRVDELNEGVHQIAIEENSMSRDINMAEIHNAIKALPDGSRTILNLYLLEGYQHKEIARILGISESTSKTQYRRGKLLLQEKLSAVYYNEE